MYTIFVYVELHTYLSQIAITMTEIVIGIITAIPMITAIIVLMLLLVPVSSLSSSSSIMLTTRQLHIMILTYVHMQATASHKRILPCDYITIAT